MGQNYEEVRDSADILIVGGGIAGLTAAVSAKEKNPDASVIVVEKQFAGYGGKANKGGGVLQYFDLDHMKPSIIVPTRDSSRELTCAWHIDSSRRFHA